MMYKYCICDAPAYVSDLFNHVGETHQRVTRTAANDELAIPFSKTSYYLKSLAVQGSKLWNNIPSYVRESDNVNIFKYRYKRL